MTASGRVFGTRLTIGLLTRKREQASGAEQGRLMPESPADAIVRNLIEALERLRQDLDRMELWTAALDRFAHPIPDYRPDDQRMLDPLSKPRRRRSRG